MKIREMKEVIGGDLGKTTKMPGYSHGLSTSACGVGCVLQEKAGSVCEGCYAKRLESIRPSVRIGHDNRTAAVHFATEHPMHMLKWVTAMVNLIDHRYHNVTKKKDRVFRWHDSGDIQSVKHLHMINMVALELPTIQFWLPTKEKAMVNKYLRTYGGFEPNLMVRVSAPMIDGAPLKGYPFTSTVHKALEPIGHVCPAPQQNGECGSCRACWSNDVPNVSYHKH